MKKNETFTKNYCISLLFYRKIAFSKINFMLLTVGLIISNSYLVWYRLQYTTVKRTFKLANLSDTCILETRNQARIFERLSHQKFDRDDEGKIHIITNIVLTNHLYYRKDLLYKVTNSTISVQLSTQQKKMEKTLRILLKKELLLFMFCTNTQRHTLICYS